MYFITWIADFNFTGTGNCSSHRCDKSELNYKSFFEYNFQFKNGFLAFAIPPNVIINRALNNFFQITFVRTICLAYIIAIRTISITYTTYSLHFIYSQNKMIAP